MSSRKSPSVYEKSAVHYLQEAVEQAGTNSSRAKAFAAIALVYSALAQAQSEGKTDEPKSAKPTPLAPEAFEPHAEYDLLPNYQRAALIALGDLVDAPVIAKYITIDLDSAMIEWLKIFEVMDELTEADQDVIRFAASLWGIPSSVSLMTIMDSTSSQHAQLVAGLQALAE
jgi:glutamate/tyrosine decarboxylase-like PLP-dependent enzyme